MPELITVKQYDNGRGCLTVLQQEIPFDVKRVFFIEGAAGYIRGGHRHKTTRQALVCISGSCVISNDNGQTKTDYVLDHSGKCLLLEPEDWHTMHTFTHHAILLVLASTPYDVNDYIDEPYRYN